MLFRKHGPAKRNEVSERSSLIATCTRAALVTEPRCRGLSVSTLEIPLHAASTEVRTLGFASNRDRSITEERVLSHCARRQTRKMIMTSREELSAAPQSCRSRLKRKGRPPGKKGALPPWGGQPCSRGNFLFYVNFALPLPLKVHFLQPWYSLERTDTRGLAGGKGRREELTV